MSPHAARCISFFPLLLAVGAYWDLLAALGG
jgi:hypothetical protein